MKGICLRNRLLSLFLSAEDSIRSSGCRTVTKEASYTVRVQLVILSYPNLFPSAQFTLVQPLNPKLSPVIRKTPCSKIEPRVRESRQHLLLPPWPGLRAKTRKHRKTKPITTMPLRVMEGGKKKEIRRRRRRIVRVAML